MSDSGRAFFEEFIDDYFAECEEHLSSIHSLMLQLENAGPSSEGPKEGALDTLLRNFHSIKGLSAMVGMEEVTQLSHHLEDYFRELKEPGAEIKADGISQVVSAIAAIEEVLAARRKSEPLPDVTGLILRLSQAVEEARPRQKGKSAPAPIEAGAVGQEKWRFEFRPSSELAAQGITVSTVRERLGSFGQVTSAAPLILDDGSVAFEFMLATNEPESRFKELSAEGVTYRPVAETEGPPNEPMSPAPSPAAGPANLIRVDMARLDDLMRIVGELVITRFRLDETLLNSDVALTPAGLRTLQDINVLMERQVRQLRQTVIRTRLVPIGQIFERMRFVVRGLERDTQKKINVEISGQDAELDKVIVERMMDPLLHLVRNAVSHGIEPPQERIAGGKPPNGELHLSAATSGDSVLIHIEDDGQGIDVERVAVRARSLGILGAEEHFDSKRLLDVICSPGFTTRDQADLASGRGVGMAAVQSAVTELGGVITLQTTAGQGTRFSIQLPLTLAIADSLLVSVENQRFAVPQASIREVFAVESASVTVFENNEAIAYRDGVLPIVRLTNLFNMKSKTPGRLHILVVGAGSNAVGLAVDRISGQRQIVVRTITDPILRIPGIVGATELGDGQPVLILDVHTMLRAHRMRALSETRL